MYSSLLKTVILPFADAAMRTEIAACYRRIKAMQSYSSDQILHWQNNQLKLLIEHAYSHTKYYKKLFRNMGFLPADINSISDLEKLPPLTKELIRKNFDDLVADNIQSIPNLLRY
jgi:phenylacetate-CoA ligase